MTPVANGAMEAGVVARAPGRVNLIGEHTDYNGGYVLPTILPRYTMVELDAADDDAVTIVSAALSGEKPTRYRLGEEAPAGDWSDYVRGVTSVLGRRHRLRGFHATIESDVPVGRGLASSAALTVAIQRALRERFSLDIDDVELAHLAQSVENDFVGAHVGIMDPLASSLGRPGEALFVDTRDLAIRRVPIPAGVELVVIDSGIAHRHATGEYNRRRAECEDAAKLLDVRQLRDLTEADLQRISALTAPLAQRARHVVTENARVVEAVAALEAGDMERLGSLLDATHRSLREDFQVSTDVIDDLVEHLRRQPGVLGARLTGGGFGGAVLAIAREGAGRPAADAVMGAGGDARDFVVFAPGGPASHMSARNGGRARPLGDVIFGGFECSTHLLRSGRRLDLIGSTRHDELARRDYRRLGDLGIHTARDGVRWTLVESARGRYDFSSVGPMVGAALEEGVRVIWDLLHFGWPDHVDPMDADFPARFGEYAQRFAELLREEGDAAPAVCPVNEISFLAFAGGEAGFFNPFARARGDDLKAQLVRAATEGCGRIRSVLPEARLIHVDPVIHVVPRPDRPQDAEAAETHRQAQFHAWDMIAGRRHPELGGKPEYLDLIGVNYYVHNQWYYPGGHGSMISPSSPRSRPLHDLLLEVHRRYGRPIFIAETGIEDEARPAWLAYVGHEARAAIRAGVDLQGICLYPVVNHPGWDDDRHCHNGLWDYADEQGVRAVCVPLAREIERQRRSFQEIGAAEPVRNAEALLGSLDEIARSIADKTDESRS